MWTCFKILLLSSALPLGARRGGGKKGIKEPELLLALGGPWGGERQGGQRGSGRVHFGSWLVWRGAGSSSPLQLTPLLQGEKRKWVWGSM